MLCRVFLVPVSPMNVKARVARQSQFSMRALRSSPSACSTVESHKSTGVLGTAPRRARGASKRVAACATPAYAGAASEFPEDPPVSLVTYRQLAPHVELARLDHHGIDGTKNKNATSVSLLPVLVGWFGCKPSYLRKYAKMYLADPHGRYDAVVCVTPPVAATLFPALGDAFAATALGAVAVARKTLAQDDSAFFLAQKLSAKNDKSNYERPIVLHLFSNGGYIFAGNVMHAQTGFVADTETPLGEFMSTALRRKLGMAPAPADAAAFVESVNALVMDSAPGELEPGMVARSFTSVVMGTQATMEDSDEGGSSSGSDSKKSVVSSDSKSQKNVQTSSSKTLKQLSQSVLAWPPIARRMRYVDAAWGGFPAVTGNRWSGDRKTRPGNAAEVAHAVVTQKLQRLRLERQRLMSQGNELKSRNTTGNSTRNRNGDTLDNFSGILKCPSLFLYSASDSVIPPGQVEQFAQFRATRLGTVSSAVSRGKGAGGGRVVLKKWERAKHCELGRDDPAGYQEALLEFLSFLSPESEGSEDENTVNNIKPFVRPVTVAVNVEEEETKREKK